MVLYRRLSSAKSLILVFGERFFEMSLMYMRKRRGLRVVP